MQISKQLELSTGHRLHLHDGGCSNIHGHNYNVIITIDFLNDNKDTQYIKDVGFFIDFGEIKRILNEGFDHRFIMFNGDPYKETFEDLPGVRFVNYPPTVENLARDMVGIVGRRVKELLKEYISTLEEYSKELDVFDVDILINETSKSDCFYSRTFQVN